jgi:molecular chaperone GrpE
VKHTGDKGQFTTEIGEDVLREALQSVEKHERHEKPEKHETPEKQADSEAKAEAPQGADPRDAEIETLKAELEVSLAKGRELMQKLKDEHEKLLRAAADLDNFKKRAAKEKEEVQRFGNERLLKDFLPVYDNFDRALDAAKTAADFDSLKKGVEMIRRLFEDTLGKHGVKAFSAKGELFDPNKHEAMSSVETTELPPNHVQAELLKGFTLNERLVRPALVVVSKAPAAVAPAPAPAETPTDAPAASPASDEPTSN